MLIDDCLYFFSSENKLFQLLLLILLRRRKNVRKLWQATASIIICSLDMKQLQNEMNGKKFTKTFVALFHSIPLLTNISHSFNLSKPETVPSFSLFLHSYESFIFVRFLPIFSIHNNWNLLCNSQMGSLWCFSICCCLLCKDRERGESFQLSDVAFH